MNNVDSVVEINVGGHLYSTALSTLTGKHPESKLARSVVSFLHQSAGNDSDSIPILKDANNRPFLDRDAQSFRYILDYLRQPEIVEPTWLTKLLPHPADRFRLRLEAEFYGLHNLVELLFECKVLEEAQHKAPLRFMKPISRSVSEHSNLDRLSNGGPYFITIGYRGADTATRDGPSNDLAKFRKITRITVSGRSDVAKEVFQEDLNDSRDPARYPLDGYTCRYYLKHNYLEYAFETLAKKGFELVSSCSSGAKTMPTLSKEEYKQWTTYMEYVFCRL
ncbi:BTB/POZ domain-containing protein KCTD12-like [Clavelina lepadiformis]|uniref:BTB/POZ domain-containing protein KCTD12-like n=1 Tax=Clavelina lepadiformis TaxID=159417 RepID=UPI00404246B9